MKKTLGTLTLHVNNTTHKSTTQARNIKNPDAALPGEERHSEVSQASRHILMSTPSVVILCALVGVIKDIYGDYEIMIL